LVQSGILQERRDGRRIYFKADTQSPTFAELRSLFEKTAGLVPSLRRALASLGAQIACAFIYGSVARSKETAGSDVDIMVIGDVGLAELSPALRKAEARLGREVNATTYSCSEFRHKVASRDHFLSAILRAPKQFLKGNQRDLDEIIGQQGRPEA
jgi:predicted nucleotidyltransferase